MFKTTEEGLVVYEQELAAYIKWHMELKLQTIHIGHWEKNISWRAGITAMAKVLGLSKEEDEKIKAEVRFPAFITEND